MGKVNAAHRFNRALITGGYSGIGAAFAERLAGGGTHLVLAARDGAALDAFAADVRARHQVEVGTVAADLSTPQGLALLEGRLQGTPDLDLLINNAAFAAYQPLTELSPDVAEGQIHLQVTAVVRLALAALPGMLARGRGTIINVSSTTAFWIQPAGRRGIYPATKAFVNMFTDLLGMDLAGTPIQVQLLIPGLVSTPFHERANRDISGISPSWFMSPEQVVEASLAGLRQGERICVPGLDDAALLEQDTELRRRIFEATSTDTLAPRYRPESP